MIDSAIDSLINGQNLDNSVIKEVFDEIYSGLADTSQISAFVTAFKSKELTQEEFVCAVSCANETFKNKNLFSSEASLSSIVLEDDEEDNYFDLSLSSDLICACFGLNVFKHSFFHPLKLKKSFSVLNALGLRFLDKPTDETVDANFVYHYISPESPFLRYTKEIYRKIKFHNVLEDVYKFSNPYNIKNIVIGTKDPSKQNKLANICLNLNYSNSIIISSNGDFPYVSIEGDTKVAEAWKNKIFTYVLNPQHLDVETGSLESLKVENNLHNSEILLKLAQYKEKDCFYNAVILNSALALYITKKAKSVIEGLNMSRKAIDDGLLLDKINQIKKVYS